MEIDQVEAADKIVKCAFIFLMAVLVVSIIIGFYNFFDFMAHIDAIYG